MDRCPDPTLTNPPAFGAFYGQHVEALTGSTKDTDDPNKVAKVCYAAAAIYAAFIAFCGMQVSVWPRKVDCSHGNASEHC